MAGPIVTAKLRRIEPRGDASIEKEGVAAAEAVAEKAGKIVKVHPSLGDDEMLGLDTPTPFRGLRSFEFMMKAGWRAPSIRSIGPSEAAVTT
jgi:hypothetical protein